MTRSEFMQNKSGRHIEPIEVTQYNSRGPRHI